MNKQLIIYHTNDMHARVSTHDDLEGSIGFDKISKVINLAKLQNKNVLYFDGGDLTHGTPRINLSHGENMIKLLNPSNLNCFVPGNHEFNNGLDQLLKLVKNLKPYVINANIIYKEDKNFVFLPYVVYNVDLNQDDHVSENSNDSNKEDIKIGVFGLTTPETAYKTHPDHVKDVEFSNPISAAKAMVKLLKNNCDLIVALTHLGLDKSSEFTSERLAKEVDGIDLIVDGHSHHTLTNGLKINNTLIVQAGSHGKHLGKVVISFDDYGSAASASNGKIDLNQKINFSINAELMNEEQVDNFINGKEDSFIAERLNGIEEETNRLLNRTIAYNKKHLSSDRLLVRQNESEIGNFAADACKYVTQADLSVINGGNLRADLKEGPITRKDVINSFPFDNLIKTYKISGKTIKEMFEHSVEFVPASFGGFLNTSYNIKFSYDPSASPLHRVKEIYINDELIDEEKIYIISMTDFQASGGDDYQCCMNLEEVDSFGTLEDIVIKRLNDKKEIDYNLGRIIKMS